METGSNKSLYTLIAVVVFGIFLSLSYFLFQDSLKGVLADVMSKTSQSTSMHIVNADNLYSPSNIRDYYGGNYSIYSDGSILYSATVGSFWGAGFGIGQDVIKADRLYSVSFDMQVLSGRVYRQSGHLSGVNHVKSYLDGVLVGSSDTLLVDTNLANNFVLGSIVYPADNAVHHVEVQFDTSYYGEATPSMGSYIGWNNDPGNQGIFIQPFRQGSPTVDTSVLYSNININFLGDVKP